MSLAGNLWSAGLGSVIPGLSPGQEVGELRLRDAEFVAPRVAHPQPAAALGPRGFRGTVPGMVPDVWIPINTWIELTGDRERLTVRGHRDYEIFARLTSGVTLQKANAELTIIAACVIEPGEYFAINTKGAPAEVVAKISAAGISQEICPPITPSNIRVMPVLPHIPVPTLPVSLPVSRPNPL